MKYLFLFFTCTLLMTACGDSGDETLEILEYDGPLQEAENIVMYYSETADIKVKLEADKLMEFENGDREFPEGIYMEFFDETGAISSTLKADQAFYFKEQDLWRGRGNVIVRSYANDEQLDTEELFWDPGIQEIYTDKTVIMTQGPDIMRGKGMRAAQDFSWYTWGDPDGVISIQE
jgi:LPS export ABC transporter protein LptC